MKKKEISKSKPKVHAESKAKAHSVRKKVCLVKKCVTGSLDSGPHKPQK